MHPKCKFSLDEDLVLRRLVFELGEDNWHGVAAAMGDRNARQCRERWFNYLSPNIRNVPWTREEDILLLEQVREQGPRWHEIARFFPMRTDINIKNRYHVLDRQRRKEPTILPCVDFGRPVVELPTVCALFTNPEFNVIPPLTLRKEAVMAPLGSRLMTNEESNGATIQDMPPATQSRPFSLSSLLKA
jgi:hypothetical protein